ncbi:MAG: pirin family protein [Crocinitomicaceae bacterium]
MSEQRRTFLGKMLAGFAAIPLLGATGSKREKSFKAPKDEEKMKKTIKRTRALGFQWETADPFLFCVHHEDKYPAGNGDMAPDPESLKGRHIGQDFILKDGWRMYHGSTIPGFPGHPHRGFETITVVREGMVDHADSTGAAGRYGNGDVQWMTAGKGVQHSEMFPLIHSDKGNDMELFQIWLNLPKKSKMVEPHFKMLWREDLPIVSLDNNRVRIEVIAGKINGQLAPTPPPNSWASEEENTVGVFNIRLEANGSFELGAAGEGINRTVYYYEGNDLAIGEEVIPNYHAAEVDPEQRLIFKNGSEVSKVLILQGKPIDEPVVQHGPFVMNSRQEIQQAFEDYHATQFGGWPWERYDQVHDKSKGRFALHGNGHEEVKP